MFLASYNSIEVTHPASMASMAVPPEDDEQTDCEASVSGTPRGGIFSPKPRSETRIHLQGETARFFKDFKGT